MHVLMYICMYVCMYAYMNVCPALSGSSRAWDATLKAHCYAIMMGEVRVPLGKGG